MSNNTQILGMEENTCLTIFGVLGAVLALSVFCNIYCFVSRCCSGNAICQPRKRQRHSPRQMEDNPIYGNVRYTQTSTTLLTEGDPLHSSNLARVNSDSQSKTQDCYANLTLKAPKLQSGRSSPQIQYSDVLHFEQPLDSEREGECSTGGISNMSDLYASVQYQRSKTVDHTVNGQD